MKITFLQRSRVATAGFLLIVTQVVFAQVRPDTPTNPFAANPTAAIAAGKHVFDGICIACHGPSGSGTERAPALDSGQFKHGGEDFDLFQTIQKGVPGTQMPSFASFSPEQTWQLVSYVQSLSRVGSTSASGPALGDAARGEQLFFGPGQCSSCHEVNGRGLTLAPDLSDIGKRPPAAIAAAMEHPFPRHRPFGSRMNEVNVTLEDGTHLEGVAKSEDSFSVVLQTLDGNYRVLDRSHIRIITENERQVIPFGLAGKLTADQRADLLAYLSQHKQRADVSIDSAAAAHGAGFERLAHAEREPQNWLTYWGSYASEHFSPLQQIDRHNVTRLQAKWALPMPGSSPVEATPLVVDGLMYVSGPPGDMYALDARTGLKIWYYHRQQETVSPFQINAYNRGVAVLGGRVFMVTLDCHLIALDARSGRVLWDRRIADTLEGYTLTGAPLALDNRVIVGVSGGEMGVRGFLDAYDVNDGHQLWRFNTIPGPGEPGHESWSGDSWKTGSGATWLTGSYDPQLHLLYWAVGNPGPDFDPTHRQGDNLFTCSVLALDPDTGRLVWHYQFTPNDSHDWDSAEDLVLARESIDGKSREVLLHADRNGFLYTLDRTNGKFISAVPFVRQNWNKGFDADGRPVIDPASLPTPEGRRVWPSVGGTNFQAPSYDSHHHVFYLAYMDSEGVSSYQAAHYTRGQIFSGAHFDVRLPTVSEPTYGIMALDVVTGRKLWVTPTAHPSLQAGVLATRGEVVFAGTTEGNLLALDALSGKPLWHFQTGGPILAAPMSYSVDGAQFVALSAGNMLYGFALPEDSHGQRAPVRSQDHHR